MAFCLSVGELSAGGSQLLFGQPRPVRLVHPEALSLASFSSNVVAMQTGVASRLNAGRVQASLAAVSPI